MTRVAGIDCGTNSIRLLVADIQTDGTTTRLSDVVRRMEIVRLGHGVDRTGRIAPEAMSRTLAAARTYAEQCTQLGAERLRFVATSASRDAENAADFVAGVREAFGAFGISPEVVSGDEEASLSFLGAVAGLAQAGMTGPYLVVDLGGGSTEFVRGTAEVEQARSVDFGSVRMTERHLTSDPPTAPQIDSAGKDVEAAIDEAAELVDFAGVSTLVGVAGSITTVTANALGLDTYDSAAIHLSRLPVAAVLTACTQLLEMSRSERAALPYMHPGRVDVIGGGALDWRAVVERLGRDAGITEVVTSEHDILDGIALSIARPA